MDEKPGRSGVAGLVREPLLHYLLIGLLAFGIYSVVGEGSEPYEPPDRAIEVTGDRVAGLRAVWLKKWNRPPTERELRGVIEATVREEILSREAIALGLDRDDTIVRRRLAQKLEFLIRDLAPPPEPTEAELTAFLKEEAERFHRPPAIAFTHVFFSPDRRGAKAGADADAALARLRADPEGATDEMGDAFMLGFDHPLQGLEEIERRFGPDFAKGLDACPPGRWSDPVQSAFGLHLVLVRERREGGAPDLDDVRDEVRRDLMVRRREEARKAFYGGLRAQYRIDLDEEAVKAAVIPEPR